MSPVMSWVAVLLPTRKGQGSKSGKQEGRKTRKRDGPLPVGWSASFPAFLLSDYLGRLPESATAW
jgi:hypothetical protein